MNNIVIKKSKKRVAETYKIYLWLFYNPIGQTLCKAEKELLASYINLYLNVRKIFKVGSKQDVLINNYVFGTEAKKLLCSDLNISMSNLNCRRSHLKKYGCLKTDKNGNLYLNKEVLPKFEKNGDIIINTTIRFV